MTLSEILLEQALKTSGKDNAVSGKAWEKPPEMEKKVVGTGNQKVSLARKQSLHGCTNCQGPDDWELPDWPENWLFLEVIESQGKL